MAWYEWPPYVPVAVRREIALREIAQLRAAGRSIAPVTIEGRAIARSFWGKAWCKNLERYTRLANRLPRGRTYVRNGSVMDLQLGAGTVDALVSGSELYRVSVTIVRLAPRRWKALVRDCAGRIGSLVELLQGKFSRAVMETLIRPNAGLFPSVRDIAFACSCPDQALLCKHVAATLYGVGARLDTEPELFFRLRCVDQLDLIMAAQSGATLTARGPATRKRIAETALAEVFGIELDEPSPADSRLLAAEAKAPRRTAPAARRPRAGAAAGASEVTRAARPRRAASSARAASRRRASD